MNKLLMLSAGLLGVAEAGAQSNPNVVFILCDDLGYSDLGCYGQELIATPHIDRMAAQGLRFTQHYAGSAVSAPSRACMMTGQHTGHTKIRDNKEYWTGDKAYGICRDFERAGQEPLDTKQYVISQLFKSAGYRTGLFGKWGLGYEGSEATPLKMGFDEFYGYNCQFQAHLYFPNFINRGEEREELSENTQYPMYGDGYEKRSQYTPDLIHREAMRFLEKQSSDQPFFLYLTYTLPHAELRQPHDSIFESYRGKFEKERVYAGSEGSRYNPTPEAHAEFAAMVTRLDSYVGEVIKQLEKQGLAENTLVFFASDNGPHIEGGADPDFFNRGKQLRGIKRDLYEGGIRVPLIAYWPGTIEAGRVTDHISAFWDFMPTYADLLQKKLPQEVDGISMLPTILGKGRQKKHDYLYWEFNGRAVRKGDWKLIRKGGADGKYELFDLSNDEHEDHNVAAQYPRKVKELNKLLEEAHDDSHLFHFK